VLYAKTKKLGTGRLFPVSKRARNCLPIFNLPGELEKFNLKKTIKNNSLWWGVIVFFSGVKTKKYQKINEFDYNLWKARGNKGAALFIPGLPLALP